MWRSVVAAVVALACGAPAQAAPPVRVAFTTPAGTVLAGVAGDAVEGTVAAGRGVAAVRVTFCGNASTAGGGWTCGGPLAAIATYDATLRCASAARRSCTWSAPLPVQPGRYLVVARGVDRSRRAAAAGPIDVLVV